MNVCTSCNTEVTTDFIEFKCPKCQKEMIRRCQHCRDTVKRYTCTDCGFEGP